MPADAPSRRSLPRWLLLAASVGVLLWLAFFDSHSLMRRLQWHREVAALQAENARLEASIESLEVRIEAADTPEVVERIAREQYGMRKPGETVYRVEAARE